MHKNGKPRQYAPEQTPARPSEQFYVDRAQVSSMLFCLSYFYDRIGERTMTHTRAAQPQYLICWLNFTEINSVAY